jgi:nitrite reductase/ring-hydroxylating ferredoxin subunit
MPEFRKVASVDEIPAGEAKAVDVEGQSVALYNVDGEFFATTNICSHDEAYLAEGWLDDDIVTCPAHGAEFCVRTGEVLSLPATQPVATYPVRVEGDEIYVAIGD